MHHGGVEALLLTLALLGLMAAALLLLAKAWPHSSRRTGYRISGGDRSEGAPPVPEDDEAKWRWRDR